jgi:hypothetical protein
MPDRHINYGEISEYGKQFIDQLPTVAGQSELVDVAKLGALVSSAMLAVETELQKTTDDRSDLRGDRTETVDASAALRDNVSRFYYHLRSLPKTTDFDFDALFPGQTLGDLGHLKPADLVSKAADVLRGFDTPKNKNVAAFASWKTDITTTCQTLSDAISGKSKTSGKAFVATAALVDKRKNFLHAYNKVAKPIIRGLLAQLNRENEYELFFKDLSVNEGGHAKTPPEPTPEAPVTP